MARNRNKTSGRDLLSYFTNQFGFDIETSDATVEYGNVVQAGIVTPSGNSIELNLQNKNYKSSKFHSRPGGLNDYYTQNSISLANPTAARTMMDGKRRYESRVMAQEQVSTVLRKVFKQSDPNANIIIHNAQFEIKHLSKMMGGKVPFRFSQQYTDLINTNKAARFESESLFRAGKITADKYRELDAIRQVSVYEQIVRDAKRGGSIIDTMEIAKTANALAQQKGLIVPTGDLALGTGVDFLSGILMGQSEKHRSVQDVWQQNDLAPQLVSLVEKLKRDDFNPSILTESESAWAASINDNHVQMKVEAQQKAIKQAIDNVSSGRPHAYRSGTRVTDNVQDFVDYLGRTGAHKPAQVSQGIRLVDHGVDPADIVKAAVKGLDPEYKRLLNAGSKTEASVLSGVKGNKAAAAVLGGAALLAGVIAAKQLLSSDDDAHNTIEGLPHGWFGKQRKGTTDFGSGYKGPIVAQDIFGKKEEAVDQTPYNYGAMAAVGGAYGLYRFGANREINILGKKWAVDSFNYMGATPAGESMSGFLGRKNATYGDALYNMTRRAEMAFGGFPKAFSTSVLMSPRILRDATFAVDLTEKGSAGYGSYLNELTGVNLADEGILGVEFRQGKLYASKGEGAGRVLLEEARLYNNVHDKNISKGQAQFAKSMQRIHGVDGVGSKYEYLIGGSNNRVGAAMKEAHAYAHETLSKYLRLVDDPAGGLTSVIGSPTGTTKKVVEQISRWTPKLGVGGEKALVGTLPQLLKRHAWKSLPLLIGLPALYKTADWAMRQIAPEDSVAGKAGFTGIAAEAARIAHMTFAKTSDILGMTALRQKAEEAAPGMTGVAPFVGLGLSGLLTGGVLGAATAAATEAMSSTPYEQLLKNKDKIRKLPGVLGKLPGFKGKYSLVGQFAMTGAAIGLAAGVPMLLAGLGSSKSAEQLAQEYSGEKEVAIKKGRWWEFGMTPYEGSQTDYYRENWYNRTMSGYKRKADYGDEDISPVGELARSIRDPYWREKMHYDERPFPVASSSGDDLGIFGPLYERTIGQVLKPRAYMHTEKLNGGSWGDPGMGSVSGEAASNNGSIKEDSRQQLRAVYEAVGLRGFVGSTIVEGLTGDADLYEEMSVLQSSSEMNSGSRAFWDLNLGGGAGLTEPIRRFAPGKQGGAEIINEIDNKMPSWLPGEEYFVNFKKGDAYSKVAEGEYRLPGRGYAARYKELEGVNAEEYPDIHKYKILADVAMYSHEFRAADKRMRSADLSAQDRETYQMIRDQVDEKKQKRKFQRDEDYTGLFGLYAKSISTASQLNPLEHLTPLSPAHKFLPRTDAKTQYEQMVFAKEYKFWQNPISDFVSPTITYGANLLGIDVIPEHVKEARQIEQYFDELKYAKSQKLKGSPDNHYMSTKSLLAADPYNPNFNDFVLPKRERSFFEEVKTLAPADFARIHALAPDDVKDIYQAQWDMELAKKMTSGQIEVSEEEKERAMAGIGARQRDIRTRRDIRRQEVMESDSIPDDNWIGWSAKVDLEDVKLKYLLNEGKDFHYYDLWDDRARKLRTQPLVAQAASGVDPLGQVPDNKRMTKADALRLAAEAGIIDPSVSMSSGPRKGITVDASYDSRYEEDATIRHLGHVI